MLLEGSLVFEWKVLLLFGMGRGVIEKRKKMKERLLYL